MLVSAGVFVVQIRARCVLKETAPTEIYSLSLPVSLFFFNDTATTEIYTLSLHDALPIFITLMNVVENLSAKVQEQTEEIQRLRDEVNRLKGEQGKPSSKPKKPAPVLSSERSEEHTSELQSPCNLVCRIIRSEEHTSELQSPCNIVCRLLLEKKIISRFSEHGDLGDQTVLGLQRRLGSTVFFVSGRVITHLYDMLAL